MPNANASSPLSVTQDKNGVLMIAFQVIIGLVIVYIMYAVLVWALKRDQVHVNATYDENKRQTTPVFTGFVDGSLQQTKFNTTMSIASNYVPINPSVNIKGGSQFTYTFWLYVGTGASDYNAKDKVLFLKGSEVPYDFEIQDRRLNKKVVVKNDRMVYCPMVKFGKNLKTLEVCFNTLGKYDEKLVLETRPSNDTFQRNNLLSMTMNTWVMVTITFEDNVPINEFENGIVVKVFLNETQYKVGKYPSALKQNYGDLFLFPNDDPLAGIKMSNLSYYNYILTAKDISDLFRKGPNTNTSSTYMSSSVGGPPVLSDYNTQDIFNLSGV